MKQFGIFLALALVLVGCGGGSSSNPNNANNINGTWTATLTSTNATPAFAFGTTFTQSSGTSLSVVNFNFTSTSPCFVSGGTQTGGFSLTGNFNGNVSGAFQMTVQSGTPSGNMLSLQGNVNNSMITGTWTLTGVTAGCSGSGNFTMTKA